MDKFIESSLLERKNMQAVFEKNGIAAYGFTDEASNERHDGFYFNKQGKKTIFEVKNRNIPSSMYPTTIIEESKYQYLMQFAKKENASPALFVFFSDGLYTKLDLNTATISFRTRECPKTSAGNNEVVKKSLCEIKINRLKLYKYNEPSKSN